MPGLQEWIHKFEVGEGTGYIKVATLILAVIGVTLVYDLRETRNFSAQEAMDAAQIARNIREGRGFSTRFVRPLSLHLVQTQVNSNLAVLYKTLSAEDRKMLADWEKQRTNAPPQPLAGFLKQRDEMKKLSLLNAPHPDLANGPVYPYLLAGLMKVLPFDFKIPDPKTFMHYQPEILINGFNQGLFFLSAVLVYFLGKRLFDASVGWVTMFVFLGAELFWRFSVSGLPTMFLVVVFLLVIWCLCLMEPAARAETVEETGAEAAASDDPTLELKRRSTVWFMAMAALTGSLVGVGGLTLYSFGWLLAPVVMFFMAFFGKRRLGLSVAAVLGFAAVMGPWIHRNYQVSNTPFGTAGYAIYQDTLTFPGNRLERALKPDFTEMTVKQLRQKMVENTGEILRSEVPKLGGSWVAAFFLVSLLFPFRNPTLTRLRIFLLVSLAVLVAVQALGRTHLSLDSPEINTENLLTLLAPVLFMYGVAVFFVLLDQMTLLAPAARVLVIAAFVFVVSLPQAIRLLPPRTFPIVYPPYYPPFLQMSAGEWLNENELLMADMPWATAWYGNRQSIWLTLDSPMNPNNDFFAIHDYQKSIQAVCLTPLSLDGHFFSNMVKNDQNWGRFIFYCLVKDEVPGGFPLRKSPSDYLREGFFFFADRERWKTPGR